MTKAKLFTVILDYGGGTYIAQVAAESPMAALPIWIAKLKNDDLKEWGITRNELTKIAGSETVVPLDDCVNVWCISGSGRSGLVLINIVATSTETAA